MDNKLRIEVEQAGYRQGHNTVYIHTEQMVVLHNIFGQAVEWSSTCNLYICIADFEKVLDTPIV